MGKFSDDFLWQVYVVGLLNQDVGDKKSDWHRIKITKQITGLELRRLYFNRPKNRLLIMGLTEAQLKKQYVNVYITPMGHFICVREAAAALNIHWQKVRGRCMDNTKKVNKCAIIRSELTDKDFGKTYQELGYGFVDNQIYYPV